MRPLLIFPCGVFRGLATPVQAAVVNAPIQLTYTELAGYLNPPSEPYHSQALAILTSEQQAELARLSEALQLGGAASEAAMFSLIAPLKPVQPVRYDPIR